MSYNLNFKHLGGLHNNDATVDNFLNAVAYSMRKNEVKYIKDQDILAISDENALSPFMPLPLVCKNAISFVEHREKKAFWLYDITAQICYANDFALSYLGMPHSTEVLSADLIDNVLLPENKERWEKIFSGQDINHGNIIENATILIGPHRGDMVTLTGAVMARDKNGQPLIISGVINLVNSQYDNCTSQAFRSDNSWDWDLTSNKVVFSDGYKAMLGYSKQDAFPTCFEDWLEHVMYQDDRGINLLTEDDLINTDKNGDYFEKCVRLVKKDGNYIWILDRGMIIERDKNHVAKRIIGYSTDINIISKVLDKSLNDAYSDPLTGLHNRSYLNVKREYYESEAASPLSAIYLDITGLKATNDYCGHEAGDKVITTVASIISNTAAQSGTVVRLGGDEFVLCIPHCNALRARMLMTTIKTLQEEHNKASEKDVNIIPVIFSMGYATIGESDGCYNLTSVIDGAEKKCRLAKQKNYAVDREIIRKYILRRAGFNPDLSDERLGQAKKI